MQSFRTAVSVIVVGVALQAQCFALCTAIVCEGADAASQTAQELAAAPCHGPSSEGSEQHHEPDPSCTSPHLEGDLASKVDAAIQLCPLPGSLSVSPFAAELSTELAPSPPVASASLRSLHVTVLLI